MHDGCGSDAAWTMKIREGWNVRFSGKVVLITGASGGIGRELAKGFAGEGAVLALVGRDPERTEVIGGLVRAGFTSTLDITKSENCSVLLREVRERLGGVDVLVNNAGGMVRGDITQTGDGEWMDLFGINVHAPFFLCRELIRSLRAEGRRGAIVNIASVLGLKGKKGHIAYCATKGALVQMTRCMALDCAADGIRVNAVCPGTTDTSMIVSKHRVPMTREQVLENCRNTIPLMRPGEPAEIAAAVMFLASDAASYVTGAVLPADGGASAG